MRFSEDIDLILDWRCVTSENPLKPRSNSKQDLFNKDIQNISGTCISTTLCKIIADAIGEECSVAADPADPHVLLVKYPESFPKSYITPHIKLEIGPLASWIPNDKFAIETFVGEASSTVRCWAAVAWMERSTGRLERQQQRVVPGNRRL